MNALELMQSRRSVRTFDVETQLSKEKLQSVSIINNTSMQAAGAGVSLLHFVGSDVTLLVRDVEWLRQRGEAIGEETLSHSAIEAQECDHEAMLKVGRSLPAELRETALGGMAACPSCIRRTQGLLR